MTAKKRLPSICLGQSLHIVCLAVLLALVWKAWGFLNNPSPVAFWIAVFLPVAHQVFVWLAWRLELRSATVSKSIGFTGYLICFFVLFAGRFVALAGLAWIDRGSLGLPMVPQVLVTGLLSVLGFYAGYSVKRYFGMARAAGADHFELRYRELPLVKKGIFRFTDNGMYVYAFMLFWAIALGMNSSAALAVTAFSHAYIWVHFYATEKPDMDYLYGEG